jgi:tight adherence protein B
VLGLLPIAMTTWFMSTNPAYLLGMWHDSSGQHMLIATALLQICGCLALWRMLRSI